MSYNYNLSARYCKHAGTPCKSLLHMATPAATRTGLNPKTLVTAQQVHCNRRKAQRSSNKEGIYVHY